MSIIQALCLSEPRNNVILIDDTGACERLSLLEAPLMNQPPDSRAPDEMMIAEEELQAIAFAGEDIIMRSEIERFNRGRKLCNFLDRARMLADFREYGRL